MTNVPDRCPKCGTSKEFFTGYRTIGEEPVDNFLGYQEIMKILERSKIVKCF